MLLIGRVQVEPLLQDLLTCVICEALVGSWSLLLEDKNCVDVIESFQPLPEPLASVTVIGRLYFANCMFLLTLRLTWLVAFDSVRLPALTTNLAVPESA